MAHLETDRYDTFINIDRIIFDIFLVQIFLVEIIAMNFRAFFEYAASFWMKKKIIKIKQFNTRSKQRHCFSGMILYSGDTLRIVDPFSEIQCYCIERVFNIYEL